MEKQPEEVSEPVQTENPLLPEDEDLRKNLDQLSKRFCEQMKDFRENQNNSFQLDNPHQHEIFAIHRIWRRRPVRNERYLLHLDLINCQLNLELIKIAFRSVPSIIVRVNGVKIESNGVLLTENDYFYEGDDNYMVICSESRGTEYQGEVKERIPHGKGQLICKLKKDGYIYKGDFFQGKYHGEGQLRNSKNVIYIGQFKNDFKCGKGVQMIMKKRKNPTQGEPSHTRKSVYNGCFQEGYRSGSGVQETNHAIYRGEWKNGVKCGQGEINYKNGDSYQGNWENNQFQGQGKYTQKNNCEYQGSFLNGKYHGEGVMEYANGDKYEGYFIRGKKEGKGIYTWENGDYYDGQWRNDSAEGRGTSMIGTDFYDGDYKNGVKHGIGQLTNQQGDVLKARWENGQIVERIQFNGEIYKS